MFTFLVGWGASKTNFKIYISLFAVRTFHKNIELNDPNYLRNRTRYLCL